MHSEHRLPFPPRENVKLTLVGEKLIEILTDLVRPYVGPASMRASRLMKLQSQVNNRTRQYFGGLDVTIPKGAQLFNLKVSLGKIDLEMGQYVKLLCTELDN